MSGRMLCPGLHMLFTNPGESVTVRPSHCVSELTGINWSIHRATMEEQERLFRDRQNRQNGSSQEESNTP